jgi:DNA-binding GntR family transcriptional regulator
MDSIVKHRSPARPRRPGVDADRASVRHPSHAAPLTKAGAQTVRLAREVAALAARAGWIRGRHLTEQELARALSVSRTPIRAALKLLATRGALKAEPNRGFFLLHDGAGLAPLLPEQPTTADDVLQMQIIRDRVAGTLPVQVAPADLAQRYGTRRATLDRVLGRLAAAGLVTREAGQKWHFLPSLEGPGGVRASYQLRALVEPGALLMDSAPVPRQPVDEQRRYHLHFLERVGNPPRSRKWPAAAAVFELDAAFHETLAGFSGNSFVIGLVRQQNALRRLLEFNSYTDMRRVVAWVHEHVAILDALAANDRPLASQRLRQHLTRAAAVADGKPTQTPSR